MKNLFLLTITILTSFTNYCISQNIWEPTNGPNGLDLYDVVITTENTLVVSAKDQGIFISKDKGLTWTKIYKGLNSPNSYAFQLAAGSDGIVYAEIAFDLYRLEKDSEEWVKLNYKIKSLITIKSNYTGFLYVYNDYPSTILYSSDKGETFQKILANYKIDKIGPCLFFGNGNNFINLEVNGSSDLYRMNDSGNGLQKIAGYNSILDINWHPAGYLFIETNNGLVRMDRNGQNLFVIKSMNFGIIKMIIKPNGNLLALTYDGDYESDDLGLSFMKTNTSLYQRIIHNSKVFYSDDELYLFTFYCEDGILEKTNDDGISWSNFEQLFANSVVSELFSDKSGRLFARTCRHGKYSYSDDKGRTWKFLNLPKGEESINDLVSTDIGNLFVLMGFDVYKSVDLGEHWTKVILPGNSEVYALKGDHKNIIYAFGYYSPGYISKDGGNTWSSIGEAPFLIGSIYFHPDGSVFSIPIDPTISKKLYITEDEGLHWSLVPTDFHEIKLFHISKKGNIYIGGRSISFQNYGLILSFDKLSTFTKLKQGYYSALVTDENETIYASGYGFERSTDEGITWEAFLTGLPTGLYSSFLTVDEQNYLYAAFRNDVVYKTVNFLSNPVATKESKSNTQVFIHPNPVEFRMNISISNKNISSGHYKIIDLNGTEKLKGEFQSNNFIIDCSSLSGGMAFIQIYGKDKLFDTKKILIAH